MTTRREFMAVGAGWAAAATLSAQTTPPASDGPVSFFLVGDTHYLANRESPREMGEASRTVNGRLVDWLNRLPGTEIPMNAGGGRVAAPRGIVHVGDVIDTGDKNGGVAQQMQETEWAAYVADYGLTGTDGRVRVPVYEVHGNHDSPSGTGVAITGIRERNRRRPGVTNVSANGLHYSWDWGGVHFVCVGIVVGGGPETMRRRRYNPLESHAFLADDLRRNVGDSGRPVVIAHHVDVLRYSVPCEPNAAPGNHEWDPCDVQGYYRMLRNYRVAAILYGHTHVRRIFRWDGTPREASQGGIPTFNNDNSAHFNSDTQAILHFEIGRRETVVREFATTNRWQTGAWTPQVWRFPLG